MGLDTHRSDCNTNRAGAGPAIDWGDNNGNHVTTLGGDSIDVGVLNATALNAADNRIHPSRAESRTSRAAPSPPRSVTTPATSAA